MCRLADPQLNLSQEEKQESLDVRFFFKKASKLTYSPELLSSNSELEYNTDLEKRPLFKIELSLPKEIGLNALLFEHQSSKEEVKIGFWSENFTTWNVFKLNLRVHKSDYFASNISINDKTATSNLSYNFRINQNQSLNLGLHANVTHDILIPEACKLEEESLIH